MKDKFILKHFRMEIGMEKQSFINKVISHMRMPALCLLLVLMFFVAGCSSNPSTIVEITPTPVPEVSQENIVPVATPTGQAIDIHLSELTEVFYYTVNPDTFETEAVSSIIKSDVATDPQTLIILIGDSLEDAGYEVGINWAELDGENVVVDFYPDTCPVTGLTEEEEKAVLDAIAQSLLDNLAEQSGVVFQIMGDAYESDNFSFGQNYIYMKNHHK